jgi:colanic acid biosynthesis glycosyl transferase WcaI
MNNKVLIINQVFWPDKINTARHITELAEELTKRGWNVTALISSRSYIDHNIKYSPSEGIWNGITYKRVYVPPFTLKKNIPRLISAIWIILIWTFKLPFIGKFDAIILGTNPPFSYLLVPFIRLFKRKSKILMWGFDLYPEAITNSGGKIWKFMGAAIKPLAKFCYSKLDVIVDIGPCMRDIYRSYKHTAKETTLPPWSFVEPIELLKTHNQTRLNLFGDAKLTLLYSGTIGNAHEFENFLSLARELQKRKASVSFCFAGFGNRFDDLKNQVTKEDVNISFAGFVNSDEELEQRLSSSDFMLISLKKSWTGISVPSKFFGAIATGNAILFSGSKDSGLSIWTKEFNLGYHLTENNINEVADILCEISNNPILISEMKQNAFNAYKNHFSKNIICDAWDNLLKTTIGITTKAK